MPLCSGRADPSVFRPVEFDFLIAGELRQIKTGSDGAQSQTVRFRDVVNMVGGDHRSRAGHVLDDDFWISRDMFAHVSRVGAGPQIMGVAGEIADGDPDRFALKERSLRCGVRRGQKYAEKSVAFASRDPPSLYNKASLRFVSSH